MRTTSGIRALVLLLIAAHAALSLDPSKALTQDAHRIWGLEEGLFQPTVYSIVQTRDGFLWLGTQDSLIRFDGAHFREFEWQGRTVLHGSPVRALLQDDASTLWVATIGNGLGRVSSGGAFERVPGLPSDNILCLDHEPGRAVIACTDKGLIELVSGRVRTISPYPVRATCRAESGPRWLADLEGRLQPLAGKAVPGIDNVTTLACDGDVVWAGTASDGVVRIRRGVIDLRLNARTGLPDNAVGALSISSDHSVWIGTDDGVSRWRNGELSVYRTRDGLSHSVVLSLYVDREGTLWTGTKDGLDQFTDPKLTPYSKSEGLSSNEVGPVLQDRTGVLWIGTLDHGIDIFDGHSFRNKTRRDGLASDHVVALAEDGAGNIWAGTDRGLNRIAPSQVITGTWDLGKSVHALQIDGSSRIWAATGDGVDEIENGRMRHTKLPAVYAFVPGFAGELARAGRPITSYLRSEDGTVWMGTLGSGLLRWRSAAVARVHVKDGLYDNRIYQLLRDDSGNIWMASSKGIFNIPEHELNAFADGKLHSVISRPFTTGQLRFECRSGVQPAACRTRDGRLWFSTTSGLVALDPNHLVANSVPPPARITALLVDGERRNLSNPTVLPWQKNLEIRYTGLSFLLPEKVTFRYMLDGYDKSWIDAGVRREAFYTNLPPGQFRFRVLARNSDGVWGKEASSVAFTVQPRLYQRAWFWPVLAAVLALAVFAGYRHRVRRMQNMFSLLLAERSRIARELHDTLLQGIAGITMQMQALWHGMPPGGDKQILGGIIRDAGQCAAEARRSLWGLRSPSAAGTFSDRLAHVCRQALAGAQVRLQLTANHSVSAAPEVEYQLLRIVSQAVANVARHAQADTVRVRMGTESGWLAIRVEDDGRGFCPTTDFSKLGHFGLVGMRERAADIGAELNIDSSPGGGTIVSVRAPGAPGAVPAKEPAYEPTHSNPVR